MKNYLNLIQELSLAQRIKRGKAIKRKMSIIKRKRQLSMKRPPTPEKMERGVKKAVRLIGFAVKDKAGKYKDASPGEKERIEKRVSAWLKKVGGKIEKRIRPKTMKKMRDAYRARQKGKQISTVNTKKIDARIKRGSVIGESNEAY